ncbi:hypothetical protein, partial [Affinibrenneria salicis]|uniref:hypothetical protein n=1 Tax=Affinibrenneria salicis TaxID=2590031 RepID=UPI001CC677B1
AVEIADVAVRRAAALLARQPHSAPQEGDDLRIGAGLAVTVQDFVRAPAQRVVVVLRAAVFGVAFQRGLPPADENVDYG